MTSFLLQALAAGSAATQIRSAADLREHRARRGHAHTVEQAALAGLVADGMGWAFAAGYEAALARLDPKGMQGGVLGSLCATEGDKAWVTLGSEADLLLVVASVGASGDGRNRLRVARVPAARQGVVVRQARALPFVPEIAHAKATFDAVAVGPEEILPGDGYDDALKPFRTIEDIHVMAAVLGWAIGVGRASDWPRSWIDEALALVVLLRGASGDPPLAPATHVALAGAQSLAKKLLDGAAWPQAHEPARSGWARDRPLLEVASGVRGARLEAAWSALRAGAAGAGAASAGSAGKGGQPGSPGSEAGPEPGPERRRE